jgi:hypothetical protein
MLHFVCLCCLPLSSEAVSVDLVSLSRARELIERTLKQEIDVLAAYVALSRSKLRELDESHDPRTELITFLQREKELGRGRVVIAQKRLTSLGQSYGLQQCAHHVATAEYGDLKCSLVNRHSLLVVQHLLT